MEVNLISQPGPWSCRITLRFERDSSGSELNEVLNIPFGPPLDEPDMIEINLRRAQAAVLNYPSLDAESFIDKTREELEYYRSREAFQNGTSKFSNNVVCVDVYDPDCPDLSFVDLPGMISPLFRPLTLNA